MFPEGKLVMGNMAVEGQQNILLPLIPVNKS